MATMDLKTTKSKVEWCLKNKPKTRADDMLLTLTVWKNFHRQDFEDLLVRSMKALEIYIPRQMRLGVVGKMEKLPSPDACSRVRRKFNENRQYLPDDETLKKRGRKIFDILEYISEESL